jgi:hypothetical protein
MTIDQAIVWLTTLAKQHGPLVEVYFDCPKCGMAFRPNTVVAQAVHIKSIPKSD